MKVIRLLLVVLIALSLVFLMGCAKRKTVKPTQEPPVEDLGEVDDYEDPLPPPEEVMMDEPEPAPEPEPQPQGFKYIVRDGDTLWGISSKSKIYEDAFQWPLLFKSNRDGIEDPDMIEIDQELEVRTDYSNSEIQDARQKAMDTPAYRPHTAPRKKLPLRY